MASPLCSLIVVNHNGRSYLPRCLDALQHLRYPRDRLELILVDNASSDGSIEAVHRQFPTVSTLLNTGNNFAQALNLGIANARGQCIGFVNNDVIVDPLWLNELVWLLDEQPTAGAVGGKLRLSFSGGGKINSVGHRRLPKFFVVDRGFGEEDSGQYDGVHMVDGLCWAAVLFRRACLDDVGPIDEDFVLYFEDVDYAVRSRSRAWTFFYTHRAIAYHEFQGSSRGTKIPHYFCNRNRLVCVAKHVPSALPRAIETSHFYVAGDFDALFECLPIILKKLMTTHDAATVQRVLPAVCEVLIPIYGLMAVDQLLARLQVVLGHRRMSLAIYDYALHVIGGGQKYTSAMASILQDMFEVTLIANKPIDRATLEQWYLIDLSRCGMKAVPLPFYEAQRIDWLDPGRATDDENPFEPISRESGRYDVFVDANMNEKVRPLAPLSLFVCCFPERGRGGYFFVDAYTLVLSISRYTTEWMRRRWGLEPDWLLYPAVDMEAPTTVKDPIILSVARFEPGGSKKQKELIQAFTRLRSRYPETCRDWKLVLVGGSLPQNVYLEDLRALVAASDGQIDMRVNVATSEVQASYAKASIFWHACGLDESNPHLIEHFGMTTVEAMQNRCVPVVINGGGQREIVEHRVSGLLFDTVEELCDSTLELITHPDRFRALQEGAYHASQRFSQARFEQRVRQVFETMSLEYSTIPLPDPATVGRLGRAGLGVLPRTHEATGADGLRGCPTPTTRAAVFEVWGKRAAERQDPSRPIVAWTDSPVVLRHYIHPAISGHPDRNWLQWVAQRYFATPAPLALSLGTGDGALERHGVAVGLATCFEGVDASADAVTLARHLAQKHPLGERITYSVADLNDHRFESHRYDAVFASMAVHHVRRLEHLFAQVARALKPGGLFVLNEFVGPNQFQWSDRQLQLANELLQRIPNRYRQSVISGHLKTQAVRQPLHHMNLVDPTEAIRSADILPLLVSQFEVMERIDYGGTLLNLVLEEIAGNFQDTADDLAILTELFDAEREALTRGLIQSDFAVLVTRPVGSAHHEFDGVASSLD